jgi:hypothetical protein
MTISLGFGILFGTVIILTIVPSVYLILEEFFGNYRNSLDSEETNASRIS